MSDLLKSAREGLGVDVLDSAELIEALRAGLPLSSFTTLQTRLGWTPTQLAAALYLSERTLQRRFKQGRFNPAESQRLLRLARLVTTGEDLFSRTGRLGAWLRTPALGLGGQRPVDLLDTDLGTEEVETLVLRLLHGIVL